VVGRGETGTGEGGPVFLPIEITVIGMRIVDIAIITLERVLFALFFFLVFMKVN
jgi:hypothetical protein